MTVAVTRTKAEQAYSEIFEAVAAKLPGGRAVAEARKAAIGAFAGLGFPHRRIEEWKYTDLRSSIKEALPPALGTGRAIKHEDIDRALGPLAALDAFRVVFVDGSHRSDLSQIKGADGLEVVATLSESLGNFSGVLGGNISNTSPHMEAVVALNTAYVTDGAIVNLAEKSVLEKPLLLVFARSADADTHLVSTCNSVEINPGAKATLIEAHIGLAGTTGGQVNALSDVFVDEGATLTHVKCTLEGSGAIHVGSSTVALGAAARYRAFQLTAATALVRNTVQVTCEGEGAKLDISGCFLGRANQHIDTTLVVDHAVPGCESRELFKGVLADKSRGIFQGKVIVRPDAQKTDGKQMAQVLMLSEDAEFDSKPELEIYADDVVCGHGSTAAELDSDALFYLRSRGIALEEARRMLIESFVGEALDKIEDEQVRGALSAMTLSRLAGLVG